MISRSAVEAASRARAERVKAALRKMFPSFEREIERLRIRHHVEVLPTLIFPQRPELGARDVQNVYISGAKDGSLHGLRSAEEYLSEFLGRGQFFGRRTYGTRFFPSSWTEGIGLRDTDIHEFAHYLTALAARLLYGRAGPLRVPVAVQEGIAFAFQHRFLRDHPEIEYRVDPDLVANVYGRDPRFDVDLFRKTFERMRRVLEERNYDEAAQKIPEVLREVLNLPRRKALKRP